MCCIGLFWTTELIIAEQNTLHIEQNKVAILLVGAVRDTSIQKANIS